MSGITSLVHFNITYIEVEIGRNVTSVTFVKTVKTKATKAERPQIYQINTVTDINI